MKKYAFKKFSMTSINLARYFTKRRTSQDPQVNCIVQRIMDSSYCHYIKKFTFLFQSETSIHISICRLLVLSSHVAATMYLTHFNWIMVWCLLAVLAMMCPPHTGSQHLPTRDEDHFHFQINHAEIFYDTKLLPDGAEAITYIFNGTHRKYEI